MKKILAGLAISFSALMASSAITAAPQFDPELQEEQMQPPSGKKMREKRDLNEPEQRSREQRGMKRLQHMKWQTGYVMPQHYRSDGYKVEYKENNLPKPARNQQWYKINNNYILLNSDNNNIVRIEDR
jgi:Ni/Co efflux regulator RcnB